MTTVLCHLFSHSLLFLIFIWLLESPIELVNVDLVEALLLRDCNHTGKLPACFMPT